MDEKGERNKEVQDDSEVVRKETEVSRSYEEFYVWVWKIVGKKGIEFEEMLKKIQTSQRQKLFNGLADKNIEKIKNEVDDSIRILNEVSIEFTNLGVVKANIEIKNIEKDTEIKKLEQKLQKAKTRLSEYQDFPQSDIPEIYLENKGLKKQIEVSQDEHYLYSSEMVAALELLKDQLQYELSKTNTEASETSNNYSSLETSLYAEKEYVKALEIELASVKSKIIPVQPNNDDDSSSCNCTIY